MRIVDAHHHIWDPDANPHPWLTGPAIPFRYGDYTAIRRPFLWDDYDRVTEGRDIVASVTMEGEWDPRDPLGEARWMLALADRTGRPAAHVSQAWLDAADVDRVLGDLAQIPIVRGIRHKPRANPAPGGPPGGMTDPAFIAGFRRLSAHGLIFELQTPWWHLDEAIGLAAHAPDVPIVLNHAGLPHVGPSDGLTAWHRALTRFAQLPQARLKISGLGAMGGGWTPDLNRQIIVRAIDAFGPERCMFASNYPVDGLCAPFGEIWSLFETAVADYADTERAALFHGTACRTYGLTLEDP